MSEFVLAEPNAQLVERLTASVSHLGARVARVDAVAAVVDAAVTDEPLVIVIGPSLIGDQAFELAEHVAAEPHVEVVMVPAEMDAVLLRRALRAGVADVVAITEPITEVASAMSRALTAAEQAYASGAAGAESDRRRAKVITVFSTKGGVGKTVLATNLAVALAKLGRVAIVDLDLEFGDVGIMLGIKPEHTIFDAIQGFDRLDVEMLQGVMEHHPSGVDALLAPLRPEDAEGISAARVGKIIDLVAENYEYIVIDTSPSFTEAALAALDRTDELYVITMMDVASIKNTRISLQKLVQLGYGGELVRLVLNRSDSQVLLQRSEVEQAIGGKIAAYIPSDRLVPRSVNKGVPVVLDMPKSQVAKSILGIAKDAAVPLETEVEHVA